MCTEARNGSMHGTVWCIMLGFMWHLHHRLHLHLGGTGWGVVLSAVCVLVCFMTFYNYSRYSLKGRPKANVDIGDILELRHLNYKWTKIASILGVSRATVYRRLEEAGISPDDSSPLTDNQLDEIITSIKRDHPNDGEVLLQGHLLRQGIRVSRQALRNAIHRVDHENTVARRRMVVRRRIYSVPYPNYIWHVDGHHKLIRWRMVTHGAVDGYSRCITFLKSSDNNRASTVLDNFYDGVSRFGLPERIRSDHGGENVGVWRSMLASHDNDYSCVVTGSSVHNERIERMWRDVNRCVTSIFLK